jgi:hypothetical protein
VAVWTLKAIASFLPTDASYSPRFTLQPSVDSGSPAALSIGTGLLFGLFRRLHSTRGDLIGVIRAGAGQITGGKAHRPLPQRRS